MTSAVADGTKSAGEQSLSPPSHKSVRFRDSLDRQEGLAAIVLTAAAVWLRVVAAVCAGGLWRDEANTVGLATLARWKDVLANLQYDSFPVVWLFIVRAFASAFGPTNDAAFRALGFLVGLSVISALWFTGRTFGSRYPLASLVLIGISPAMVRWGDSARAYGLGTALIVMTCGCLWRFVTRPAPLTFLTAVVSAVLSVQTLYYAAPALLSFSTGAVIVCRGRRDWRTAAGVMVIGIIAAASLLPYLGIIQSAASWNTLVSIPDFSFSIFALELFSTIAAGGPVAFPFWLACVFLAIWAGFREGVFSTRMPLSRMQRDAIVFAIATLVTASIAIFIFLKSLSYRTEPWYYLTLLAIAATCIDIVSGHLLVSLTARRMRIAIALIFCVVSLSYSTTSVARPMTNADHIAAFLKTKAQAGDLIVVTPWHFGISFDRYYDGGAQWTMLPPIGFTRFHRYDILLDMMKLKDPEQPVRAVVAAAREALEGGHSVYVIGSLPKARAGTPLPPMLPPADTRDEQFKSLDYQGQWTRIVTRYLDANAAAFTKLEIESGNPISEYENISVFKAQGLRH